MTKDSNRRRFHRFPFDADACLLVPGVGRIDCDLIDLSMNGVLLSIRRESGQVAGLTGTLDLVLSGLVRGDRVEICSKVEAVWQEGERVGCCFVGVDSESFSHLKTLIEDNLGDPCLLDRELTQLTYWPGVESSSRV